MYVKILQFSRRFSILDLICKVVCVLVLEVDRSNLEKGEDKDLLDRAYTVIENRVNALGVAEPSIQKQGNDRIIVELPGLKDEAAAKGVIGRTAQLQFNLLRDPAQLRKCTDGYRQCYNRKSAESCAS